MADQQTKIIHRELDTRREQPSAAVAELVAELKGVQQDRLDSTWEHLDDILANIFSDPPAPEAQVEVTFSYEGFRVTVEQDGSAKFVPV